MPFISGKIGKKLTQLAAGYDGVVPTHYGNYEPLCAVYKKTCLNAIEKCLIKDVRKVIDFYPVN